MFKLTVVAGPNRGASYTIREGETTIGRQSGNVIVLPSVKVSKRHCSLIVTSEEVIVKDQGSSNGTFVNGILAKLRRVGVGDRISVGEFVLEVSQPPQRSAFGGSGGGNVIAFPGMQGGAIVPAPGVIGGEGQAAPDLSASGGSQQMPTDLKGKLLWYFEHHVMPIFYGLTMKHQWRMVGCGLFAAFVIGNLVISVHPLMESSRATVVKETGRRARFMARQIVERNTSALAQGAETRTEIGSIEREEGVRVAVLADLENRIIAPAMKSNQYLASGLEASLAIKARDAFRAGREEGIVKEVSSDTIVAIEPVRVIDPRQGKNVSVAMAIVSLDTSLATPDFGAMGVVYSETLILTGLLGGLILLILYRMTLKPFQVLNDDLDKALKGEISQVTHEFKIEELNQFWDVINATVQRVRRSSEGDLGGLGGGSLGPNPEDFTGPLRMLGGIARFGLVLLDHERKVLFINPMFEEISGIRSENAIGQDLGAVGRDQAFGALCTDILDRAMTGSEGSSEDFDFSGISYKMYAAAFGASGSSPKCYVVAAVRNEG